MQINTWQTRLFRTNDCFYFHNTNALMLNHTILIQIYASGTFGY